MKKEIIIPIVLFLLIGSFFFYPVFFGKIPFPGDLLLAQYKPWQTYSYLGYIPGTIITKDQYFDTIREIYPWKSLVIQQLKKGVIPLWNPYNFSGTPLLANFQSAALYPLSILYFILPQTIAWTILIILQPLLASIFTYLYARKIQISKTAAVLVSVTFSYSLFMGVFLEFNTIGHVILWMPLLLLLVENFVDKITAKNSLLFVFAVISALMAGHIQVFGFVIFFVTVYCLYRFFQRKRSRIQKSILKLSIFFVLLVLAIGICSIQLIPTLELIKYSARSYQSYDFIVNQVLLQPYQLILFILPDFFGNPAFHNYRLTDSYPGNAVYFGIIPLLLTFFAISVKKFKNIHLRFYIFTVLVLILILVRTPFSEQLYKINIPLLSTGSPSNAFFILSFSLSLLAGIGIDQWAAKQYSLKKFTTLILIVFVSLVLFIGMNSGGLNLRNYLLLFVITLAGIMLFIMHKLKIIFPQFLIAAFIVLTIIDLQYFYLKFNPFVPSEFVFPEAKIFNWIKSNGGINRSWGYGHAAIQANFATQYGLYSTDGVDPLYIRRYGEFIYSSVDGKILSTFDGKTRSDALIVGGFGKEKFVTNKYRLKVLDMMGVKYILDRLENGSTEKTFPGKRFNIVYKENDWIVLQNKQAADRYFITTSFDTFTSSSDFETKFYAESFDPRKTILLEELPIGVKKNTPLNGYLNVLAYEPNRVIIKSAANESSLLFLSDTLFPGWKAFVDGTGTKIYRANYAFRAIVVPKGIHTVRFEYQPDSFIYGTLISTVSILLLIIYLVIMKLKLSKYV